MTGEAAVAAWLRTAGSGDLDGLRAMRGADTDAPDQWGRTALMAAAFHGHTAAVTALLDWGADVHRRDTALAEGRRRAGGNTALHQAAIHGHMGAAGALLARGASADALNHEGQTPLMRAAAHGRADFARLMLDHGADTGRLDHGGLSALMLAACQTLMSAGAAPTVSLLLARGAGVDARNRAGKTALMCAAENGRVETLRALLGHGADPDAANTLGRTALMYAAAGNVSGGDPPEAVRLLLAHGADPNARNAQGKSAMDWARRAKRTEVMALLRGAGAQEETP